MSVPQEFFASTEAFAPVAAVELPQNPTLVLGAPLSGKTTLLRGYVRALEQSGLSAEQILVLTPTRLAAAQLRDLIALDSPLAATGSRAQSITGFAFSQLSDQGVKLLTGAAQEQLLRQLVDEAQTSWRNWGFDPLVPTLRGFVQELRDLLAVLIENEVSVEKLTELQQQHPKVRYRAALDILPRYLDRLAAEKLVDPSQLPLRARDSIFDAPAAVLVDDAQNFSLGQLKLVEKLLGSQSSFMFGDPDAAVLGFRNSSAGAFIELARARGFAEVVLSPAGRKPQEIENLAARVAARIPTTLAGGQRPKQKESDFSARLFQSQSQESDYLAAWLRRLRIERDLSWDQMVVIGRTRTQLEQLATELAARSVPTRIQGVQRALRDQPMARALLDFIVLALAQDDQIDRLEFLTSPLIGMTSLDYRRLLRQLRQLSGLSAKVALGQLLTGEAEFEAPALLSKLLSALDKLRAIGAPSAHQAVSIGYELASSNLDSLSKGVGPTALAANRSIDSALELFAAAQRFDERNLGLALDFALQQLQIAIPEDSLAPIGLRPAVQLATPSLLHGSYPVVALPRLQEGIWPNLNPRNSLLGASSLQAFLSGRISDPSIPDRAELADELRFFYRALGSASSELWLSALVDEQEQPSQFFQILSLEPQLDTKQLTFDLRQLVGRLRRRLAGGDQLAARQLAAFAIAGIPGADPASWHGLAAPEARPISGVSSLAASRIEEFEKCPLHWFIKTFGGDASGFSASLGTLLHSALERAEQDSEPARFISENWHTLEFESRWQETRALRSAGTMAALITDYLSKSNPLVASEQAFEIEIAGLEIRGKIDRIEKGADGFEVVDLKTGKSVPTAAEVAQNRQLAIYQLAVKKLHGDSAGARIVSVGSGKLRQVGQPALTPEVEQQLTQLVTEVSTQLQKSEFIAQVDEHCSGSESCTLLLRSGVTIG